MNYLCWTEDNDWEGETWHFYIPTEGNEEALALLKAKLEEFSDNENVSFELSNAPISERDVDVLVDHSGSGYMNEHNKMKGKIKTSNMSKSILREGHGR